MLNVTTERAALGVGSEEVTLDGDETRRRGLAHDMIKDCDSLQDLSVVCGGASEVGIQAREVNDSSGSDDHAMNIGASRASSMSSLLVKVDVETELGRVLGGGPGKTVAIEDPTGTKLGPGSLAVPHSLDQTTLLGASADHHLVLVDGGLGKTGHREGVQLNVDGSAEGRSRQAAGKGVTSAAGVRPHSGTDVDVLDIVADAFNNLRSRTGSRVTVAVKAGKVEAGTGLSRRSTARLALALSVTLAGAKHIED